MGSQRIHGIEKRKWARTLADETVTERHDPRQNPRAAHPIARRGGAQTPTGARGSRLRGAHFQALYRPPRLRKRQDGRQEGGRCAAGLGKAERAEGGSGAEEEAGSEETGEGG